MTDISDFAKLVPLDNGLCVVSTMRAGGTVQSTVVNAGVLEHPISGLTVVGFVAIGVSRKLVNLRANPRITVVVRAGWQWAAVEGHIELVGPDDPRPDIDADGLRFLLRAIFTAAGGTHDDWEIYDRVMADERRAAVLVTPERVYSNG